MGFLKLGDYGLVLTPEGRLLSTRPAVLDDGFGGKIVGWREGDLAAMELPRWGAPPATPRATAIPSAIPPAPSTRIVAGPPPIPTASIPAAPAIIASPVLAMAPLGPKRAPTPMPLETQPMIRVDDIENDEPLEDEWEWEIAVARARAQAEWADEAAQQTKQAATPVVTAPAPPPLRMRAKSPTAPVNVVTQPAKPPIADRWDTSDRTKTAMQAAPEATADVTKTSIAPAPLPRITQQAPTRPVQTVSPVTQTGRTVIPVPTITQVTDPSQIRPRARVNTGAIPVRPNASVMSPAPRRFPRATGPATSTQQTLLNEDTQVTQAAPANDDLTSPGLLAAPSNTSSNAKRVAAKQR